MGSSAASETSALTGIRGPNRWAVLVLVAVAQLMVTLDVTIVNIALPSAQRSLHFSTDSRQWLITAYALAFGSLLLLGGKLGDLFGRKWTFTGGLIGFAVASAIGGLAQSFAMLVAARALQGAFGALLAPSAPNRSFPDHSVPTPSPLVPRSFQPSSVFSTPLAEIFSKKTCAPAARARSRRYESNAIRE